MSEMLEKTSEELEGFIDNCLWIIQHEYITTEFKHKLERQMHHAQMILDARAEGKID